MKLIQSRDNPFFKHLKRLAESGRERRKTGQTLLDGVHLVEAYEAAHGSPVETLVVGESALAGGEIADYVGGRAGRRSGRCADARPRAWSTRRAACWRWRPMPKANVAVDLEKDAILLDGVQDPGNVGTLLRTAAAAGVGQALLGRAAPRRGRRKCCAPGRAPILS
jgi:TrmH family RNA methyltransferase